MALTVEMAKFLMNRQPAAVHSRLQESGALRGLGIRTYQGLEIESGSILLIHLLSAAQRIGSGYSEEPLPVMDGGEAAAFLRRTDAGQYVLSLRNGEQIINSRLGFLELVSPELDVRVRALEEIVVQLGPTSDISAFRAIAQERSLSEEEMDVVLTELFYGVAEIQSRLRTKLRQRGPVDLVPDSLDYFEKFCGPDPGTLPPDIYLGTVLPAYRRELLHRDLRGGLEISLLGSLRDDLCPGPWLEEVDHDLLWSLIAECHAELDPISLLAVLNLAVDRLGDPRFHSLAEEVIPILAGDRFLLRNDVDVYQLVSLLAQFVLNRINLLDGGALRPPFWKRMCAWMQAGFLFRLLRKGNLDFETFSATIKERFRLAGEYASSVDLRKEPMIEAAATSPFALRREVLGRLLLLEARHEGIEALLPSVKEVTQARERMNKMAPPLSWNLPGPLEGYRLPAEQGRILPEVIKPQIHGLLSDEFRIAHLANLSQHFGLDDEMKELLHQMTSRHSIPDEADKPEVELASLLRLGTIAAAERDAALGQKAADKVMLLAPELRDDRLIMAAVTILLRAAAAFEDEAAWAEWLEKQLFYLASGLSSGEPSKIFWLHIQELKRVTKLELGILRRAEGASSAAASW